MDKYQYDLYEWEQANAQIPYKPIKMTKERAQELIVPLISGKAVGVSQEWSRRLIEALLYVIEKED